MSLKDWRDELAVGGLIIVALFLIIFSVDGANLNIVLTALAAVAVAGITSKGRQ